MQMHQNLQLDPNPSQSVPQHSSLDALLSATESRGPGGTQEQAPVGANRLDDPQAHPGPTNPMTFMDACAVLRHLKRDGNAN